MDSKQVKELIYSLGADICAIASIERFASSPEGYHPLDVYPECKSVISFACRFPVASLSCKSNAPYTQIRNSLVAKIDAIALNFCIEMEKRGIMCVPVPCQSSEWDEKTQRFRGSISLKHAAQAAGLGAIGRHSLLITPEFGSMVWLGAVLCAEKFQADELINAICANCNLCVKACPAHALDGEIPNQQLCNAHAFAADESKRTSYISCHKCRDVCPNNLGSKNSY